MKNIFKMKNFLGKFFLNFFKERFIQILKNQFYSALTNEFSNNISTKNEYPSYIDHPNLGLKFDTFIPKKDLLYFFFAELCVPNQRILNDNRLSPFGIENASDVQRFRYYPNTFNIYTFIGFTKEIYRTAAMLKTSLLSASLNLKVYLYPFNSANINIEPSKHVPDSDSNKTNDSNINKNNEMTKESKPNQFNYASNKFNYNSESTLNNENKIKGQIQNKSKSYKFNYKPDSNNSNNENEIKRKKQNDSKSGKFNYKPDSTTSNHNNKIKDKNQNESKSYKFNYKPDPNDTIDPTLIPIPTVHFKYNTKNLIIKTFVPNKNLFYYFFNELGQPNMNSINNNSLDQFGLYDASDIQRYRYYPGTTNIFTFIGFSNSRHREEAKVGKKINKVAFKNLFYDYPYKQKIEELFTPDENLFYVYFKELIPSVKQIHLKEVNNNYYGCESINDLQKGYKIRKEDKTYYTFFGFVNENMRLNAIKTIKERHDIVLDSIKIFCTKADNKKKNAEYDKDFDDSGDGNDNDNDNEIENKDESENCFDEDDKNQNDVDDDFDENDPRDGNEY